ncbi:MAG: hypothetical protein IKW13_07680, partial [Thermoguttaceae bacterium]|nr:hypothetical protein [Thermoguttaceae bacterium]
FEVGGTARILTAKITPRRFRKREGRGVYFLTLNIAKVAQSLTAARNAKTGVALGSDEGTGAAPVRC